MINNNLTVVLIVAVALAAACYAIKHLHSAPARVAGVLIALAALIGALQPVVQLVTEQPSSPAKEVAPTAPAQTTIPGAIGKSPVEAPGTIEGSASPESASSVPASMASAAPEGR